MKVILLQVDKEEICLELVQNLAYDLNIRLSKSLVWMKLLSKYTNIKIFHFSARILLTYFKKVVKVLEISKDITGYFK